MNEQWKPVTQELLEACTGSFFIGRNSGLYEVSDMGRIRNTKTGKVLKTVKDHVNEHHPKGRPARIFLAVQDLGGHLEFSVSHLVYGAFHPELLKDYQLLNAVIGHRNGDKEDNRVENLYVKHLRAYLL